MTYLTKIIHIINITCMNIRMSQLKALIAIVENGSVTAAAAELCLTQSTVSKLLAGLELEIGFDLFDRIGKRLRLTDKGRLFLVQARQAIETFADLDKAADDIRHDHGNRMRIAAIGPLSIGPLVPNAIASLAEQFPDLSMSFEGKTRIDIEDWVAQGRSNIGFTLLPVSHAALSSRKFRATSAFAVVPLQNPLSSRKILGPRDLTNEPMIMPHSSARVRGMVESSFINAGLKLAPKIETSNAASAVQLASQGAGIAVLDPFSYLAVPDGQVRLVRWEPEMPMIYGMIYQSNRVLTDIENSLFEMMAENVDRYLGRLDLC